MVAGLCHFVVFFFRLFAWCYGDKAERKDEITKNLQAKKRKDEITPGKKTK